MEPNARCLVCQRNQTFAFSCSMSSSGGLGELIIIINTWNSCLYFILSAWRPMDTKCPQGTPPRLPFHTPSESICERVYAEDAHRWDASPEDTGCGDVRDSEQTEEISDHVIVRSYRQLGNPAQTQNAPSSGGTSSLVVSEWNPHSPYRSQSPMETSVHWVNKQYMHIAFNQREKQPSQTVYVTLDSLKHGQDGSKLTKSWIWIIRIGK